MKTVAPNDKHIAFRRALEEAIRVHAATLDALDILAVLSHLVGQVVALQDQRTVTPEMAMELVANNLQSGNAELIEGLLGSTGGTA
jgi:hypothetical protein